MAEGRPHYGRHLVALSIIVVCVGLLAYAVVVATRPGAAPSSTAVASSTLRSRSVAPTHFVLPRLVGSGSASLATLIGHRPAVLNFFASWCPACAAELAAFATVSHEEGQRVAFIGVDTADHDPSSARALLRHAGDAYPVLVDDADLTVASAYGIGSGLPVTFFIGRDGRVQADVLGKVTTSQLRRLTGQLLAGEEPAQTPSSTNEAQ